MERQVVVLSVPIQGQGSERDDDPATWNWQLLLDTVEPIRVLAWGPVETTEEAG